MKNLLLTLVIIFTAISCKKEQTPIKSSKTLKAKNSEQVIDKLIIIDSLNFTNPQGNSVLTEARAQKVLEDYYASKGYIIMKLAIE